MYLWSSYKNLIVDTQQSRVHCLIGYILLVGLIV